jgi:hypothetical protein
MVFKYYLNHNTPTYQFRIPLKDASRFWVGIMHFLFGLGQPVTY